MARSDEEPVRAPHPPLAAYFPSEEARRGWVRGIFDRTAGDYERVERTMALGSGAWYRGQALRRAGLAPGMRVVDVGTGTGLVARAAARIVGDARAVIGVDPSAGMRTNARLPEGMRLLEGAAESIPLPDGSADFLSMGYALRHISDLSVAFAEFHRVLAPGGIVCILEITPPASRVGRAALKAYLRGVVPLLARAVGRSPDTPRLMRYYWDTIEACIAPERVIDAMRRAGFVEVGQYLELGIFREYTARKEAAA